MITVEKATELIREHLPENFRGQKKLLEDLIADRDYPPFHRVMMDGIAVSFEVYQSGKRRFEVAGVCPAGVAAGTLSDFTQCLEVMTGAPLPVGADLIIPYEHVLIEENIAQVTTQQDRLQLEHVHLKGSDCRTGDLLCSAGEKINGPVIGIATSLGYANLKTSGSPRINIISTGDELVEVEQTPLEHQIRRSNAHALKASLALFGHHEVTLSHLSDDEAAIEKHYSESSKKFDLLIYSGGVSRGKFDYLPAMWRKLGVSEIFHGISQRPGKPMWFGMDQQTQTAVFGLPGNPVSSLVCLHRYFLNSKTMYAVLDEEIVFKKDLTSFVPVKISSETTGLLRASPLKIKNSGEFQALAGSDGFLELPKDQSVFKVGEAFPYYSWGPL